MKIKIKKLAPNAAVPARAHETDLGYDVVATSREEIAPNVWKYGIGLAFEPEDNLHEGNIGISFHPRSSVWKTGLILSNCEGLVDKDYRAEVAAVFYKVAPGEIYKVGDRIGQLKLTFSPDIEFEVADELNETERGMGGYGSTGR